MLIENPELFKAWLTAVLEPLCDADPAALAKYVYALVKKDKTLEELRGDMVEQWDVFLQKETKNFVELLFKTLETREYVFPPPKSDPDGGGTPPGVNPSAPVVSSSTEKIIDTTIPLVPIVINPPAPLQINESAPAVISKRETRKSDSDKDKEKEKRSRSRSGRMRSRTRSWERDRRRSGSREHIRRDRERDRSRPWRNESPPISTRRHDRRSRSTSPIRPRLRDGPDSRDHRSSVTFEELIKSYKSVQYSRRRNKMSDIIENVWMTEVNEQNEAISSEEEVTLDIDRNRRVILIEFNDPNKIDGVNISFRTIAEYAQPTIDTVVLRRQGLDITRFIRFRFASEESRDQFLSEASLLSSDSGNSTESTEESSE